MRIEEIRERTDEELRTLTQQLQEDMYKLRVQRATNQLDDTNAPRRTRMDLARVNTVLKARGLNLEKPRKEIAE
jgi:ribosomal protein L29